MNFKEEMHGSGSIEIICGPMFSGKSEELIRRLRRAIIARQPVVVYKPIIDNRFDLSAVVSHSQHKIASVAVTNAHELEQHLQSLPQAMVIGIDEAQFFDADLVQVVEKGVARGLRVILAGLDQDYLGKPFGPMPILLAIADSISKQTAVCISCGAPATKTQRINNGQDPCAELKEGHFLVGAADSYEARCRSCYVPRIDKPGQKKPIDFDDLLLSKKSLATQILKEKSNGHAN